MFESCGYKWKFVRVVDKRTGAKTTTVCMVKPVNQDIGWARAGVAVFSPNREVVKEFDQKATVKAREQSSKSGMDLFDIKVYVTHTDKFRKDVGRLIAFCKALDNMGLDKSEGVIDFDFSSYALVKGYPTDPEWQWLDNYL